jgi:hypothetical protein
MGRSEAKILSQRKGGRCHVRRKLQSRRDDWRPGSDLDSLSEDFGCDWRKWKAFLPVKSEQICKKELFGRPEKPENFLRTAYGIPPDVCREIVRGAGHFEEIEVWGKREIRKDPIAVGLTGNGERYLICRWGVDKLIPFERIKSRSWLYHIQNLWVMMLLN